MKLEWKDKPQAAAPQVVAVEEAVTAVASHDATAEDDEEGPF